MSSVLGVVRKQGFGLAARSKAGSRASSLATNPAFALPGLSRILTFRQFAELFVDCRQLIDDLLLLGLNHVISHLLLHHFVISFDVHFLFLYDF